MAAPNRITFASRGVAVTPIRALLVAQALEHIGDPIVQYTIVNDFGCIDRANGDDCRDHVIEGRSQVEAAVAFLDYMHEFRSSPDGHDNYENVTDSADVDEFDRPIGCAWMQVFYAQHEGEWMWLLESRDDRHVCKVPELGGRATKPART